MNTGSLNWLADSLITSHSYAVTETYKGRVVFNVSALVKQVSFCLQYVCGGSLENCSVTGCCSWSTVSWETTPHVMRFVKKKNRLFLYIGFCHLLALLRNTTCTTMHGTLTADALGFVNHWVWGWEHFRFVTSFNTPYCLWLPNTGLNQAAPGEEVLDTRYQKAILLHSDGQMVHSITYQVFFLGVHPLSKQFPRWFCVSNHLARQITRWLPVASAVTKEGLGLQQCLGGRQVTSTWKSAGIVKKWSCHM